MSVALRKIIGDLRQGWGRVLLLFAAVMMGQAAMTASYSALTVVGREIARNYSMAAPPEAQVEVTDFDPAMFDQLGPIEGVQRLDIVTSLSARYHLANRTWLPITLFARRDFGDLRSLRIFPKSGAWPPARGEVLIERSGLSLMETPLNGAMEIGFGRGERGSLRYAGVVHDPTQAPSYEEGALYGYVDLPTMAALAGPRPVQFLIMLGLGARPVKATQALSERLTALGAHVVRVSLTPPSHPHADLMNGLLLLLSLSSVLSFIIALFLSGSIVASLAQRQERQMAVLRAMGASRLRIAFMHIGFAMTPALAGLFAGALLGQFGAHVLCDTIAWQLNLEIIDFSISQSASNNLLLIGGAGAVLAVFAPIFSAVRRPVREVLQDAIVSRRRPWIRLSALPPIDQMAVAEAFRRPVRTSVTVVALVVAGAALLSAANTNASLVGVVDRFLASRAEDITTTMTNTPDLGALRASLDRVQGLGRYELWDIKTVTVSREGVPGMRLPLLNPPANTSMGMPVIIEGRLPTNPGEIIVSQVAAIRVGLPIGAAVTLNSGEKTISARIVGMFDEFGMSMWTNEATYSQLVTTNDRSRQIRATADRTRLNDVSLEVEQAVLTAGSFPSNTTTRTGFRLTMVNHFLNFFGFLFVACMGAAAVGATALSSAIGSNVLERTREIGVLRTLGGTSGTIFRLVLGQALSLSLFSLALAIALSIPLSSMIVDLMQKNTLPMLMPLKLSWVAMAGWSVGSLLIALIAALAPTLRIRALPIREAIAHE